MRGYERAAQEYEMRLFKGECICEPEVIKAEKEYEPDGYSINYIYNCDNCNDCHCEHWCEHNSCERCDNTDCEYWEENN